MPLNAARSLILVALAAAGWLAGAPPAAAASQSGLMYVSAATWTADPIAGRIHVGLAIKATSRTADTPIRHYFFTGLRLQLPPSSVDFQATEGDQPLPTAVESDGPSGVSLFVGFGRRLYSGQKISLDLHFDIVDGGGSTSRDLRVGGSLFSFPVSAFGSPGVQGSSVSVVFPGEFTVKEEFGDLVRTVDTASQIVYTSEPLEDSTAFDAWFTAVKPVPPEGFLERQIWIGPLDVTLRYWADDPGWADQVERVLDAGYPTLRGLIGLGDPTETALVVEEASTLSARGLGGEYNATNGTAQVSYFADPFMILHEMAHLWFNDDLSRDRWIDEGFASYYSEQTILRLGFPDRAPHLTERLLKSKTPLNDWVTTGPEITRTDEYLYAGALRAAGDIAAIAGQDGLRQVWYDVMSGRAAYQPSHGSSAQRGAVGGIDWRGLLDYLEQSTGRSYAPIWRTWVVGGSDVSLLEERDRARSAYRTTIVAAGDWELPAEIRDALEGWRFAEAQALLNESGTILLERDRIAALAGIEGTTAPATLRAVFEKTGVAAAARETGDELSALNALAAARVARNQEGAARGVGLLGSNPEADLEAARSAFARGEAVTARTLADKARAAWEGEATVTLVRVLGFASAVLGFAGLILLAIWARRRHGAVPAVAPVSAVGRVRMGRSPRGTGRGEA